MKAKRVGYVGGRLLSLSWNQALPQLSTTKVDVHQESSRGLPKTPASTPVAFFVSIGDSLCPLDIDRYVFSLPRALSTAEGEDPSAYRSLLSDSRGCLE